jgi:hypothetical protein
MCAKRRVARRAIVENLTLAMRNGISFNPPDSKNSSITGALNKDNSKLTADPIHLPDDIAPTSLW